MSVRIVITDEQVQINKTSSDGSRSEELTWEAVEQGPPGPAGEAAPQATAITIGLVNPYSTSTLANASVYSAVYWIPPDVTTVYVQVGMRELLGPAAKITSTAAMKISAGQPSADRQSFVGTPTSFTGLTWPAFMLSDRVAIPVDRDADGYMMFRWTMPAGTSYVEYTASAGQDGYVKTIQNSADVLASSAWVDTDVPVGQVALSFDTEAEKLVIWDNSIERGLAAAGECGLLNTLVQMGPSRGYCVSVTGVGSALASVWALQTNWMLGDLSPVKDCNVLISLGTVDLFASVTSVNVILYLRRLVMNARALGAKRVLLATIITSANYTGPQEAERLIVNAWIRSQIGWVDDVVDYDLVIGTVGTNPTYFATGGVHLTALGFTQIVNIFPDLTA